MPEFIIHFNFGFIHVMVYTVPLDSGMEPGSQFSIESSGQLSTKKHRYMVRFDSVNACANEIFINWGQICPMFKNDVGGVLGLHNAPVISLREMTDCRTVSTSRIIENLVELFNFNLVGEFLGYRIIIDFYKRIIDHFKRAHSKKVGRFILLLNCFYPKRIGQRFDKTAWQMQLSEIL